MIMINKRFGLRGIRRLAALLMTTALLFGAYPLTASAEKNKSKDYQIMVSLGDSYSAGEGIEPFYGQDAEVSEKVKNDDWLAHRSENSWPGMLTLPSVEGTMAENRGTYWYFAAVSGATTEHMLGEQEKEYNKWSGLQHYKDEELLPPQLDIFDELGDEKADYVTLTLGGNDAGFADIITTAATSGAYFNPSSLADKLNNTWTEFYKEDGIRDDLRQAYNDISERAGSQARIIVAGYPHLLNPEGGGSFFNSDEAALINSAVSSFNKEIESIVNSCKASGMKICFVSVEEAFEGHEAYSDDPYINEVILFTKSEDLKDIDISSAYSIHPNYNGAKAYAKCVQAKINELEADDGQSEWPVRTTSDERDIVLVLDVSGSMSGTPMEETKKAATNFVETILKEDASIGIVTYDSSAACVSDFSVNEAALKTTISSINDGGRTSIDAGLSMAESMLQSSNAKKKIIVLMSDGLPNEGRTGDSLIAFADELKDEGILIYTLGFFEYLGSDKASAQGLMEQLASDGCHYEVANAEDLVFFFEDMADQINGTRYIYVRIACPVDVTVTYKGETLCSSEDNLSQRTEFGTLTFEENENPSSSNANDRIKVLRLKEGVDYDIQIVGTGRGIMDYTIGFMDEDGTYSDLREFENIKITKSTMIDTVATVSDETILNVDQDGDGKYDVRYRAEENGYGEEMKSNIMLYVWIGIGAAGLIAVLVIVLKIRKFMKKEGN